ncbi:MAG: ABC transporter permease subunit/CPBP intramembrane protease [Vicinamibacterales bacterium]
MSIRPRIVATIWRKELSEILRDRRTLFITLVLPVLLYPMLLMGMTRLAESESEASFAEPSTIAVWGQVPAALERELTSRSRLSVERDLGLPDDLRERLSSGLMPFPGTRVVERANQKPRDADVPPDAEEVPNPVLDAARALVNSRRADAVLVVWGRAETTSIYFDSVRQESDLARTRVRRALEAYAGHVVRPPFDLAVRDVAPASRQAGRVVGTMLPFLLLTLCIMGGLYPAIDLTAGEKERGTMQTLMCAPVLPGEIIGGKFLAVWTLSLLSALANIASLATTLTRTLPVDASAIPTSAYLLTGVILVPVTMLTSALFLALAVFAKDYKEGQSFLTPVYMALALPGAVTMLPTIQLNAWTTFVPIVNIALLIKALLMGEARTELVFLTLASSAMYAALALSLAVRVFQREQVLVGGRESVRDLFGLRPGGRRVPSPSLALVMFSVALVASFYGSLVLESRGFLVSLLVMQYGFFLLPVVLAARFFRMDLRETFSLAWPRVVPLIAAAVLGLTAWMFASGILLRIAPPPETLVRALEKLVRLTDEGAPLWVVWLVVAVTPAICEEALFRGFILSGLRPLGAVPAIGISALLFGIAHASIYRLLPTFFLGLVLGIIVWRTGSLLGSVVAHALNNGLLATLTESPGLARLFGVQAGTDALPWTPTLAGTAAAVASLFVLVAMSEGGMWLVRNRTGSAAQPAGSTPVSN